MPPSEHAFWLRSPEGLRQGDATIRVETWVDTKTGEVCRYCLAYVNQNLQSTDNGRILGSTAPLVLQPVRQQIRRAHLAAVDWLISPKSQDAIATYKVGGEALFFPNAGKG